MAKKHTKRSTSHHATKKKPSKNNNNILTIILAVVIIGLIAYIAADKIDLGPAKTNTTTTTTTTITDPIIIEEFSDFECPFCSRAIPTVEKLKEKYGDQIKIEFKQFPLNFHASAQKAAEASECARDQEKFWEYHDKLFDNQKALGIADLKKYAADLGLDTATFNTCLDGGAKAAKVASDIEEGRSKGVSGTPTFIIEGKKLVGAQPISEFDKILKVALGDGSDTPAKPAADIGLTVINDPSCKLCDSARIIQVIQEQLFPTTKVTELNIDDPKAQALLTATGIQAVPAFIFGSELADDDNFGEIEQVVQKTGDKYFIVPAALGTVKLLKDISIEGRPALGDVNAPITMAIYDDFECPFCAKFETETFGLLKENYIDTGKVYFVYKHFPLSFHQNAQKAAEASECAFEQGKFWAMHDLIFENQKALSIDNFKQWASDIELDTAQFDTCLTSGKYAAQVQKDMTEGQSDGISGTPGFIINGVVVSGALPYDVFSQMLDEILG
jgi:protein-disulfide isomerase